MPARPQTLSVLMVSLKVHTAITGTIFTGRRGNFYTFNTINNALAGCPWMNLETTLTWASDLKEL